MLFLNILTIHKFREGSIFDIGWRPIRYTILLKSASPQFLKLIVYNFLYETISSSRIYKLIMAQMYFYIKYLFYGLVYLFSLKTMEADLK